MAPQPVSFYAAVFFLVNATYICLVHELIDRATAADVSLRERRIMRFRSIVTLCVFGAAALVALKFPLVEKSCPAPYCGKLSDDEMAEYRRPFAEPGEGRRPTLTLPREIPIEGDPADVTAIVDAYADWLKTSSVPKLFLKAEPGGILAGGKVLEQARSFPAQTEVTVKGVHLSRKTHRTRSGGPLPAGWRRKLTEAMPKQESAIVRFFDTGHFALETHAGEIAESMRGFLK